MKDKALRLASVVLEHCYGHHAVNDDMIEQTAKVIQAALEAKNEPVGTAGELFSNTALERLDLRPSTGIYITPPQRTWVGLTDEDRFELAKAQYGWEDLLFAAEAKLKEKNNG
jgi:hypothetical protein